MEVRRWNLDFVKLAYCELFLGICGWRSPKVGRGRFNVPAGGGKQVGAMR